MKTLLLLFVMCQSIFFTAFCQGAVKVVKTKADCSAVTNRLLTLYYSLEEQFELQNNPEKLAKLNYLYSNSYSVDKNQMVIQSQRNLIDITKYDGLRMANQSVKVMDEESGLLIELKSWSTVESELQAIYLQYQLAACE